MVVTNNKKLYEISKHFKGQGLVNGREYWHDVVGYNYRMTNICAAIGFAQLQRVKKTIKRKIIIAERYKLMFENNKIPVEVHRQASGTLNTHWMVSILVNDKKDKDLLREHLRQSGVETRPLFFPAHMMPMYYERKKYPVAEELSSRGMNLPSWPGLSNDDIDSIVSKIGDYYGIACG
jgi:perosamine synthetase